MYIEEWMKELGWTDETLASKLNTNRVTVYRWRTEQHRLNPQKISAIAEAIGRQPEDLWRLPHRPSIDGMLRDASDDLAKKATEVIDILLRSAS